MEIIQLETRIVKFNKSNDNFSGKLQESDLPSFGLVLAPIKMLKVKDNIYHTNIDTDFILDIDIESLVRFENGNKALTTKDLYELYCAVKDKENTEIAKHPELQRIWYLLHVNREFYKRPFEKLEDDLKNVLKEFPPTQAN